MKNDVIWQLDQPQRNAIKCRRQKKRNCPRAERPTPLSEDREREYERGITKKNRLVAAKEKALAGRPHQAFKQVWSGEYAAD